MQNNRYESNIDWLDPDLPSRRCSIEYFTFLSFICGSVVTKLGSSGRSSITGQLNHFSPTYSDFMFSLKTIIYVLSNLFTTTRDPHSVREFLKIFDLDPVLVRAVDSCSAIFVDSLQFHSIEFPCFLTFYKMSDAFLINESRIQVWRDSIPNCFVVRTRLFIDFSNESVISEQNQSPDRSFGQQTRDFCGQIVRIIRMVWETQTQTTESLSGLYSSIFQKYEPKNKYVSLSWSQWIA